MKSQNRRAWADKLATWGLFLAGVLGILFPLVHQIISLINTNIPALQWKLTYDPLNLTLVVVSLLSISIGLERFASAEETKEDARKKHEEIMQALTQNQKELSEIFSTLNNISNAKPLFGRKAIYGEAIRLIKACDGSEILRTTSLGADSEHGDEASNEYILYLEALAQKIGQQKQKGLGMVYKLIMGFRPEPNGEPPIYKKQGIARRRTLLKGNNALDRLEIKFIDNSWSLDILIIGNEHLIIGFPTVKQDTDLRLGIRISNQEFVASTARWYDEHLWNSAKPLTWTGEESNQ